MLWAKRRSSHEQKDSAGVGVVGCGSTCRIGSSGNRAQTRLQSSAGLTLTDRRSASALVLVTAHNTRNESLERTMFAPERSTYAIYMPGPDYGRTARELIDSGLDAATPCAVVSNAGRANEETRFFTLAGLAGAKGIPAPALLIVGEVAKQHPPLRHGGTEGSLSEALAESKTNDGRIPLTT